MSTPVLRRNNWPPVPDVIGAGRNETNIDNDNNMCLVQYLKPALYVAHISLQISYQITHSLLVTKFLWKLNWLPNLFHLKFPTNFNHEEVMANTSPRLAKFAMTDLKLDMSAMGVGWRFKRKNCVRRLWFSFTLLIRNISKYHGVTWGCTRYYGFSKHLCEYINLRGIWPKHTSKKRVGPGKKTYNPWKKI